MGAVAHRGPGQRRVEDHLAGVGEQGPAVRLGGVLQVFEGLAHGPARRLVRTLPIQLPGQRDGRQTALVGRVLRMPGGVDVHGGPGAVMFVEWMQKGEIHGSLPVPLCG